MSRFDALAASINAADCPPFTAAQDEQTYCETIMPLVYAQDDAHAVDAEPFSEDDEQGGCEPIPGHFHYLDAGFWG